MLSSKNMLISIMSLAALSAIGTAHAGTNLILNPSFAGNIGGGGYTELATTGGGGFTAQSATNDPANWGGNVPNNTQTYWSVGIQTATGSGGAGLTATDVNNNPVTGNVGYANNTGDYLFQDVGALQANTTYSLVVGVGSKTTGAVATAMLYNGPITGVDALTTASPNVLASGSYVSPSPTVNYLTVNYTTGATVSGDLTVILGEDLQATPTTTPSTFLQSSLFNPTLTATTTATPEPASLALLAIGSLGVLAIKRRKCQA